MVVNAKVRARGDYVSSLQGGGPIRLCGTIGTGSDHKFSLHPLYPMVEPCVRRCENYHCYGQG